MWIIFFLKLDSPTFENSINRILINFLLFSYLSYLYIFFFLSFFSPCIIILFRKEREKKIIQHKNNFTMYLILTSQNVKKMTMFPKCDHFENQIFI
jgi:hypothetical protein